ncbi:hypothetical protein D8674_028275 [Pyrus ussuriensis x Pyrus communis]|uniref:Uncharacterized protein n=1 Tax=Pyrus ussuriensis x Pyrus communis TaxID=2448454 RepID=A0A5N5HWU0_9ROSA|nr:hypothetical protein D8674_028275 [Pyrus ussuriensis x Pyrus communis]
MCVEFRCSHRLRRSTPPPTHCLPLLAMLLMESCKLLYLILGSRLCGCVRTGARGWMLQSMRCRSVSGVGLCW